MDFTKYAIGSLGPADAGEVVRLYVPRAKLVQPALVDGAEVTAKRGAQGATGAKPPRT
jgi:hypothetical protein